MKRALMLIATDFEDSEVQQPLEALRRAGCDVEIAAPEANKIYRGKKNRFTITSSAAIDELDGDQYDMLVIPGGYAPDHLRIMPMAVNIVYKFMQAKKPVAAICHGPQLLISANVLEDRSLTCYESIIIDVRNAGGDYIDRALVVDGNLITSRTPADLPQFCEALVQVANDQKIPSTV